MKPIEAKKMLEKRYKKQNDYNKDKYDRVSLMFPHGYRDTVREKAKAEGKSLNAFILDAVKEKMGDAEEKENNLPINNDAGNNTKSMQELQAMLDARREEIKQEKLLSNLTKTLDSVN